MINKLTSKEDLFYAIIAVLFIWIISIELDFFEILLLWLNKNEKYQIDELIFLFVVIGLISTWYASRRYVEANKINEKLKNINSLLNEKIEIELLKQKEQEQILLNQAKHAAMGEMIGNIAHQWRQPLNALGLVLQNIEYSYYSDDLNDEFIEKSMNKSKILISSMSKTIDDFRHFFSPNKERTTFRISSVVSSTLSLIEETILAHNIKLENKGEDFELYGYENELIQVLLILISNAKDAIIENNILDPYIKIRTYRRNGLLYLQVIDNANGIPKEIINRIFEPYFTTKDEGKGTGIGLYMSKIIIENNMNGKLEVDNIDDGATFTIVLNEISE
jgi:two-component system, NtrC family, C4-dicarboxylate transport sensor histidine kinase DctB